MASIASLLGLVPLINLNLLMILLLVIEHGLLENWLVITIIWLIDSMFDLWWQNLLLLVQVNSKFSHPSLDNLMLLKDLLLLQIQSLPFCEWQLISLPNGPRTQRLHIIIEAIIIVEDVLGPLNWLFILVPFLEYIMSRYKYPK